MLPISLFDMLGDLAFIFGCHSFHILLLFEAAARMRGGFAFGGTTGTVAPPNRTAVLVAAVAGGLGPLAPDRPVVPADAREHGMVGRQRDGFLLAAGRALSSNIP